MESLTKKLLLLLLAVLCLTPNLAFGAEPDSLATCAISVTVDPIMEWAGNFAGIALVPAITSQSQTPEGSQIQTIYTNCNFTIDSDQTTTAQLSIGAPADTLVTKYKLAEDGDGVSTTGATAAEETASGIATWTDYDSFLATVLPITHVDGDGAVDVTLSVQASCAGGEVPNQGNYTATQTLTAVWTSD
ncbi:hypothetical protein LCGC14_3072070 [marine sediment metagenome]|uniref:Spore coat protein U domain-containing protein n=1 Tax=marine sediment metagenome TaxID=412755 RepID=A0A0F8Z6E5_9ZZZZ